MTRMHLQKRHPRQYQKPCRRKQPFLRVSSSKNPDGADEEPHSRFLIGDDMLDAGSDGRFTDIGTLCLNRHVTMGCLLLVMDIRCEAMSLHIVLAGCRAVGSRRDRHSGFPVEAQTLPLRRQTTQNIQPQDSRYERGANRGQVTDIIHCVGIAYVNRREFGILWLRTKRRLLPCQ
jgi:hypothetical protein